MSGRCATSSCSCLATGLLGAGASAVDAKPGSKSPRLHAFASCTNLLGYAQRNGLRVIRDSPTGGIVPPPAPDSGGMGGGQERSGAPMPVAAPAPAAGDESTSQTNVQEAGVDEPDWVKAAGTTLYVARDGKLRALDASGDQPRELGAIDVPGYTQDLLVHGDRALVIATIGFGPVVMAQVGAASPRSRWLGRTQLLEVDIADPARMQRAPHARRGGLLPQRPAHGRDGAGHRADRAARARDAADRGRHDTGRP